MTGRVAVTGLGLVTVLGSTTARTWDQLLRGKRLPEVMIPDLADRFRNPQLAQRAALQALADSGLEPPQPEMGVVFGTSRGQMADLERIRSTEDYQDWLLAQPSQGALAVAQALQTPHLHTVPALACSTGAGAIGWGWRLIQWGYYQKVICGASEAALSALGRTGFDQMGVLAHELRPFDRQRQGLVPTEGAAALVLEPLDSARARGAKVYGLITGFAQTNDAYHRCSPAPDRTQALRAVKLCLEEMAITSDQVDYLNTHGTGTVMNDQAECALIQQAYAPKIPVGATKGATGHALGATGAMEAAFCLLALEQQVLPPCPGLEDPAFDLNFILTAQSAPCQYALSHSFGFGGQNVVLGFQRA